MPEYLYEMFWVFSFLLILFFSVRRFFKNVKQPKKRAGSFYDTESDREAMPLRQSPPRQQTKSTYPRTYLQVPFSEKDIAKGCGAMWDAKKKLWFVPAWASKQDFEQWPTIDEKLDLMANEARIFTTEDRCHRCGDMIPVSAVFIQDGWEKRDHEYDDWDYIQTNIFLQYSSYLSSNVTAALKASSGKLAFSYSKTAGQKYWVNMCTHCGAKQGDHYLFHVGGPFHEAYYVKSQPYTISEPLGPILARTGVVSCG